MEKSISHPERFCFFGRRMRTLPITLEHFISMEKKKVKFFSLTVNISENSSFIVAYAALFKKYWKIWILSEYSLHPNSKYSWNLNFSDFFCQFVTFTVTFVVTFTVTFATTLTVTFSFNFFWTVSGSVRDIFIIFRAGRAIIAAYRMSGT